MKDTTILRIKVPKKLYESVSKKLIKESEHQKETVQVSLDEYTGSGWEYEVGKWVADNWPAVADALKSASEDPGQAMVDLGGQVMTLATAGTVALTVGLAVAKDSIVAAAKQIKSKLSNKTSETPQSALSEGKDDQLDQILAKVPEEIKGKVSEKKEEIKEYQSDYKMISGKCYRVDDEGNKKEVSIKYCGK
jgi:hypothetical protein